MSNNSFIKAVKTAVGEPNHLKGYTLDKLAKYFTQENNFSQHFVTGNDEDRNLLNGISWSLTSSLAFNYIVLEQIEMHIKSRFTVPEIMFLISTLNNSLIISDDYAFENLKKNLLKYLDEKGRADSNLSDFDKFKAKIETMNTIELQIFAFNYYYFIKKD